MLHSAFPLGASRLSEHIPAPPSIKLPLPSLSQHGPTHSLAFSSSLSSFLPPPRLPGHLVRSQRSDSQGKFRVRRGFNSSAGSRSQHPLPLPSSSFTLDKNPHSRLPPARTGKSARFSHTFKTYLKVLFVRKFGCWFWLAKTEKPEVEPFPFTQTTTTFFRDNFTFRSRLYIASN